MKVKLNKEQINFIEKYLKKEQPKLYEIFHKNILSSVFEIDEENASEIRDWCGDKLQLAGFNENWELNDEGKIIDELIDKFYSR